MSHEPSPVAPRSGDEVGQPTCVFCGGPIGTRLTLAQSERDAARAEAAELQARVLASNECLNQFDEPEWANVQDCFYANEEALAAAPEAAYVAAAVRLVEAMPLTDELTWGVCVGCHKCDPARCGHNPGCPLVAFRAAREARVPKGERGERKGG